MQQGFTAVHLGWYDEAMTIFQSTWLCIVVRDMVLDLPAVRL